MGITAASGISTLDPAPGLFRACDRFVSRTARAGVDVLTVQPDAARLELPGPFAGLLGEVSHQRDVVATALARRVADELRAPGGVTPLAVERLILEMLALTAGLATCRNRGQAEGRPTGRGSQGPAA
jgi:hypothetical protein